MTSDKLKNSDATDIKGPRDRLATLKNKANMLCTMHARLGDRYQNWQTVLRFGTLFFSTLFLALTFIDDGFVSRTLGLSPEVFKWSRAVAATMNFFLGLVLLTWRPADLAAGHRVAVRHYTRALYEIRRAEEQEVPVTSADVSTIVAVYLDDNTLPPISERWFLRLKQYHLRKLALSRYMDEHPFAPVWWVKLTLFWRELRGVNAFMRASETAPKQL